MEDVRHRDEKRARGLVEEGGEGLGQRGMVGVKEEGEVRQDREKVTHKDSIVL